MLIDRQQLSGVHWDQERNDCQWTLLLMPGFTDDKGPIAGSGQAAVAVSAAKTLIDPKARLFPGYSSEMTGGLKRGGEGAL
jgi:hypothetical protein